MPPVSSACRCSPWDLAPTHPHGPDSKGCLCDAQCVGFALCGVALGVAVLPAASQTATAVLSRTLLKRCLSQQQFLAVRPAAPCPVCTSCAMPAQQPLSCPVVPLGHGLPSSKSTEQSETAEHCTQVVIVNIGLLMRAAVPLWGHGGWGGMARPSPQTLGSVQLVGCCALAASAVGV